MTQTKEHVIGRDAVAKAVASAFAGMGNKGYSRAELESALTRDGFEIDTPNKDEMHNPFFVIAIYHFNHRFSVEYQRGQPKDMRSLADWRRWTVLG